MLNFFPPPFARNGRLISKSLVLAETLTGIFLTGQIHISSVGGFCQLNLHPCHPGGGVMIGPKHSGSILISTSPASGFKSIGWSQSAQKAGLSSPAMAPFLMVVPTLASTSQYFPMSAGKILGKKNDAEMAIVIISATLHTNFLNFSPLPPQMPRRIRSATQSTSR